MGTWGGQSAWESFIGALPELDLKRSYQFQAPAWEKLTSDEVRVLAKLCQKSGILTITAKKRGILTTIPIFLARREGGGVASEEDAGDAVTAEEIWEDSRCHCTYSDLLRCLFYCWLDGMSQSTALKEEDTESESVRHSELELLNGRRAPDRYWVLLFIFIFTIQKEVGRGRL